MNSKFSEISNLWLDNECYGKDYTYKKELKSAVKHLNRYFGEMICDKIKGLDVEGFIRYNYEHNNPNTGKPFSKRLLKDLISEGFRIFEFALDNELIDNVRNPFTGKKKKIPKDAPVTERNPIDDIQKQLILNVYHRAQIAALIMLYCGLRKGEIIALEWADVDFKEKVLSVTKSAVRQDSNHFKVTAHTKNGKDRYIPIPDNLLAYLKLAKFNAKGDTYIYPQKNGDMHTVTTWNKTWNSYITRLNYQYYYSTAKSLGQKPKAFNAPSGIPKMLDRFTAHQLRHTYCTMLYMAGVDLLTTSKLMGHSSIQITLEIYTHLDEKYKKLNISKFNDYIANDNSNKIILLNNAI
jgi:integrase